jgi:hypothetical protein
MSPHAGDFAKLPDADIDATVDALTEDEAGELQYNWSFWARPEQRLPDGDWINWLILAGRGMGKTRVGAETVRQWVKSYRYVNLIGATADDVRTIMVEGESGIMIRFADVGETGTNRDARPAVTPALVAEIVHVTKRSASRNGSRSVTKPPDVTEPTRPVSRNHPMSRNPHAP